MKSLETGAAAAPDDVLPRSHNLNLRSRYPAIDYDALYEEIEPDMEEIANRARRSAAQPVVVFADLDGFTGLNKKFGPDVCDAVLSVVEQIVKEAAGANFATRFGGDQFIIVADEPQEGTLNNMAEIVVNRVAGYAWTSIVQGLYVHASASCARSRPGESIRDGLLRAIKGTVTAKERGGNRVAEAPRFLRPGSVRKIACS